MALDLGFNAIWISPVPEHVEGDYHSYSATDFYSVSHHWGTEQDFHDLIAEAHARDIWIMIDALVLQGMLKGLGLRGQT